jgi:uncharacterized protein
MNIDLDKLDVLHIPEENRFEIRVDGLVAELTYTMHNNQIIFMHTGVPSELEGQGVGGKLAKAGLDYARAKGFRIRSMCSFISVYLKRHPEYQS